jgi:hypothetical protein
VYIMKVYDFIERMIDDSAGVFGGSGHLSLWHRLHGGMFGHVPRYGK